MSDPNSSPVSLPAGSYDYDALKKGLNQAARGAAKNYDDAVATAIGSVDAGGSATNAHDPVDPRGEAGYVYKDVEHPELGVIETIQVYSPKEGEKAANNEQSAIPAQPTTPLPAPVAAASQE